MIKTIGPDGEVLVMRPDVTVPLVKTVAREYLEPLRATGIDTLVPAFEVWLCVHGVP